MYILLSGKPPFDGKDDKEITEKVVEGKVNMTDAIWDQISVEAKSLIGKMLNTDYKKRIYAREALMDPWFKNASKVAIDKQFMKDALSNLKNFSAT